MLAVGLCFLAVADCGSRLSSASSEEVTLAGLEDADERRRAAMLVTAYLEDVFGPEEATLAVYLSHWSHHAEREDSFEQAECNRRWGFPFVRDGDRVVMEPNCRAFRAHRSDNSESEPSLFLRALREYARLDPAAVEVVEIERREDGYYFHLRSRDGERAFLLRVHLDPMLADLQGAVTLLEVNGRSVREEVRPEIVVADGFSEKEIVQDVRTYLKLLLEAEEPTLEDYRRLQGYGESSMERSFELAYCAERWKWAGSPRYLQNYPEDSPCRIWLAERSERPEEVPSLALSALRERFALPAIDAARLDIRVIEGPPHFYRGRVRVAATDAESGLRFELLHPAHPLFAASDLPVSLDKIGGETVWREIDPWKKPAARRCRP